MGELGNFIQQQRSKYKLIIALFIYSFVFDFHFLVSLPLCAVYSIIIVST